MEDEHSRWNEIEINEFKDIFKDPTHIKKRFTITEHRYLATISKSSIQGLNSKNKAELMNLISELFEGGSKQGVKCSGPKSLNELTSDSIKSWPVNGINIAYGQLISPVVLENWNAENVFKDELTIISESGNRFIIQQWYDQPSASNGNWFQPLIDPHHLFVNN